MPAAEIERRIAAFPDWLYEFEFEGGLRTPVSNRAMVNRQHERRRYFFDALLALSGGSLRGRRVLDLGCGAGYWALAAIEAGADFVLGVDAQQTAVEQAELVFEATGVEPARYRFERRNALEPAQERFDVVLCLGLFNHVARPLDLFATMARAEPQLIVIDTEVSRERRSVFELARPYATKDVVEYPFVLVPSPAALAEIAEHFGFRTLALAPRIGDFAGMSDYRRKRRLAFICSRGELPENALPAEPERRLLPWWLRDPAALLGARSS